MATLNKAAKKFLAEHAAKITSYTGESRYKQVQVLATDVKVNKLVPMEYGDMAETEAIGLPQLDGGLKIIHKRKLGWCKPGLTVNVVAFRCEEGFTAQNGKVVPEGTIQIRVLQA